MNRPEQAPEPTMDEILASIRRIIADDEQAAEEPVQARAPEPQQAEDSDDLMRDIEQALGRREPEPQAAAAEDEIFELTEEVSLAGAPAEEEADNSAGGVLADFEALTREFSGDEEPAAADEQVDASMDEGPAEEEPGRPLAKPAGIEASLDRGSIPDDFDFEETRVEKAQSEDINAYRGDLSMPEDLVFNEAGETGEGEEIAAAPPARAVSSGSTPSSFEEGIKEMLRPLLRSWLDENLPRLVKGALEEEARSLHDFKDKRRD